MIFSHVPSSVIQYGQQQIASTPKVHVPICEPLTMMDFVIGFSFIVGFIILALVMTWLDSRKPSELEKKPYTKYME